MHFSFSLLLFQTVTLRCTGPIFATFSGLVDFRSLAGRCYGNQLWSQISEICIYQLFVLDYKNGLDIATLIAED